MIVHVSNDFPDDLNPSKTHAVKNLLEITSGTFDHFVYSLNRRSPSPAQFLSAVARRPFSPQFQISGANVEGQIVPLSYGAPGRGIYLQSQLEHVADWIASDIRRRGLKPQLIHAHKLTMEGIVSARVAARLDIPYVLSIRGDTDTKILAARPDLRALYRRIFHGAGAAIFFAPWVRNHFERRLGARRNATYTMPVPTVADRILRPKIVGPKLLTAFHLDSHKRKNARRLINAMAQVANEVTNVELSIVGGGTPSSKSALESQIARCRSPVHLEGPIPHAAMQERMNSAGGFALVSSRESFGMVFIEALLAGCPVVYPKGWAISGYLDDCPFVIPADSNDEVAISDALRKLATDEPQLKASLGQWQKGAGARSFQRDSVAESYSRTLNFVIENSQSRTAFGAEDGKGPGVQDSARA